MGCCWATPDSGNVKAGELITDQHEPGAHHLPGAQVLEVYAFGEPAAQRLEAIQFAAQLGVPR